MKIKIKELPFEKVKEIPVPKHKYPSRPGLFWRSLVRIVGASDLRDCDFSYTVHDMKDSQRMPALILMNHSSFIDLEMVSKIFYPRPYYIVCTSDGFVGKNFLMRRLGCIPTKKFVPDMELIRDITYALKKKKISVLMYPEASYTFDGTQTPLPRSIGRLVKRLRVPVIMIKTSGAFLRDPLYNCLQKRKVKVSADVSCLFSSRETEEMSLSEIDEKIEKAFTFDNFREQYENGIKVSEPFRADGLHRILYKCAACGAEGQTEGAGVEFICHSCNKKYTLTELGQLKCLNGETDYSHIPDWYKMERDAVRREIESGEYLLDCEVDIGVMRDYKAIYKIGKGRLRHTLDGFSLTDSAGNEIYSQKPLSSYSLYADYYWYEIGDVICIGDRETLYYCFPCDNTPVAKVRLAAEEIYKTVKERARKINA